ncbi:TPA: site-specific DNA-methyltransferase [Legionella pneumophila]|nr:site-specific DNA-methyltransferase [Legionella pneumophila]
MSKYDELVRKLKEIFQIDKPELDFGIYRILNARAAEINDYLENRLKTKIHDLLLSAETANFDQIQKELEDAEKNASSLGVSLDTVPKVQELRKKIENVNVRSSEYENAVFSHLLNFFSRYYDSGDFISKRRYKGNTYSIPYAGEEVVLHWANKDQYYIKSGEKFSNYAFKLDDGRRVLFRLTSADIAKDNCKDNGKERGFALIEPPNRRVTGNNEDEETLLPVEEVDGELILRFEYKEMPKGIKQEELIDIAVKTVLNQPIVIANWSVLTTKEPTEKNPLRTLLEKNLTDYTAKNTSDYFIHKNLGGFLLGELDYYIKNEVMHLDDVDNAKTFSDIEQNLRLIQTLRAIANDLITFLAQLENFQKKLWLKKKFVVTTHYCITIDQVSETLYPQIASNSQQWQHWEQMGVLDNVASNLKSKVDRIEYLKLHPYLMVNTALFDIDFKYSLLAAIENLDETLDGLLINSDNFQALKFLEEKYRGKVSCIHIDPPYNTDTSGFIYKNNYRHSSWLSFMNSRLETSIPFLNSNGQYICHIDENEYEKLHLVFDSTTLENAGTVIWDKRNPMNGGSGIAMQHEYIIWRCAGEKTLTLPNTSVLTMLEKVNELIKSEGMVNDVVRKKYSAWVNSNSKLSGGEKAYRYIDDAGNIYRAVSLRAPEPRIDPKFHQPLIHPKTQKPCAIPPNGFSRTPDTLAKMVECGEILFGDDETTQPNQKRLLTADSNRQLSSIIQDAKKGKADTSSMNLNFPYCHPVSLYELIVNIATKDQDLILDFFAGSGTTGHAVVECNRKDGGKRKYILVEQGDYFEQVTQQRMQKITYSNIWKNGKAATSEAGVSQAFKILKLEGYEDTLNNLQLHRSETQQNLINILPETIKEDYLLRYFLNVESRGSLLSLEHFNKPFDCKLKVAIDSAGAYQVCIIDLVETFNYLIGLNVKHIDMHRDEGFAKIVGWLPTGEYTLVLWRDVEQVDYQGLNELCERLDVTPGRSNFDVIYINGDHNVPSMLTTSIEKDEVSHSFKLRQIEPEFLDKMFMEETI